MSFFERRTESRLDRTLSRLSSAYRGQGLDLLISPVVEELNELEDAAWALFDQHFLENSEGVWLQNLGKKLGVPPQEGADAQHLVRILLQIRALKSTGVEADFADLLGVLTDTAWHLSESPGWVVVTQTDSLQTETFTLSRVLGMTSADGVQVLLINNESATESFEWPSQDGTITTNSQWSSQDGAIAGTDWPGSSIS